MTNIVSWQSGGFLSAVELTMLLILQTHTARTCPRLEEEQEDTDKNLGRCWVIPSSELESPVPDAATWLVLEVCSSC